MAPIQSDPIVGVPGLTGDLVANDPLPDEVKEEADARAGSPYRSRYMTQRREVAETIIAGRRRTPDHRYVIGEIRRIVLIAGLMVAILVVATLLLR